MSRAIRRWYADPQIIEAVFAIRTTGPAAPWSDEAHARLRSRFIGYHEDERFLPVEAPLARVDAGPTRWPSEGGLSRVYRANSDRTRAMQWGPGVCALNVMPPYGHYEDHIPSWQQLVESFLEVEGSSMIEGAEQQYVNELRLARTERPSTLFSFYPPIGDELQGAHARIRVDVDTTDFDGGVTTVSLRRGDADASSVAYRLVVTSRATRYLHADVEAVVRWHNLAHQALNHGFEAAITDECRKRLRQV